jgi:hypothetical protein
MSCTPVYCGPWRGLHFAFPSSQHHLACSSARSNKKINRGPAGPPARRRWGLLNTLSYLRRGTLLQHDNTLVESGCSLNRESDTSRDPQADARPEVCWQHPQDERAVAVLEMC